MNEILDLETWRQVVADILTEFGATVAGFLPSVLAMCVILIVGWIVSKTVEIVAERGLRKLGLDAVARRVGIDEVLQRGTANASPSHIAARLLFWLLMLTFVLSAVETLGLTAVTTTIDRFIAYLPNVIAAGLIVLLGALLGSLARNVVGSAAAAADVQNAAQLGALVQGFILLLVAVVALDQLGIDTRLLAVVVGIFVGTFSITAGVAFALGARPVISHILAGHFLRQSLREGESVEVEGRRGVVEKVGATDTLISDGERRWSVPNSKLLDETVIR